ncbi:MaoC/PaaZ C-terminal domain-containing protein [[Mycobacterium] nativiensis]|uniref:MaoC/PaaZ C-terminal domain-containing protein n=1 Tax=[Mycobacterium] nativiensis TaxID=2855503 RepID=A0ABU5Y3U4_9MYCO|nr:MaoC/PaaZ C-terminal domain-containing protein [Mycolicibacter sp. MYC340]MEB3034899.1 MaoC/PaaZ C-terminal domain-containing protein [Mycolicibacter sp. MYC340]
MTDILYADDLEPGHQIPLGQYTVTEDEIVSFARQWDPVFIHADPAAAAESPLGGVIASGLHTLAIYQRLAVQALWCRFNGGIGRAFEIHFRRPVLPGTTVTGHLTIGTVMPRPERGDAEITMTAELVDDNGDIVLDLTNHSLLPLRNANRTRSRTRSAGARR